MYGIIGIGAIASAIVTGLLTDGGDRPTVLLSPRNAEVAASLARKFARVRIAVSNQAVLDACSVVVLCLRPQSAEESLQGLLFAEEKPVVSVMAGMPVARLRRLVLPARHISRAIPMISVAERNGATPVHPADGAAATLFGLLGKTIPVHDEAVFEAFSAATATVAAHFAYLEAISVWLANTGVPVDAAQRYVARCFAGLAPSLAGDHVAFNQLAREHMTPGGINAQFLDVMRHAGCGNAVVDGLNAVLARLTR